MEGAYWSEIGDDAFFFSFSFFSLRIISEHPKHGNGKAKRGKGKGGLLSKHCVILLFSFSPSRGGVYYSLRSRFQFPHVFIF